MEKEDGNREREWGNVMSQNLSISSLFLHFLLISSFSLHFLAARLQGCNDSCSPGRLQVQILLNTFLSKLNVYQIVIINVHLHDNELFGANFITANILKYIINDDTYPLYDNFVLYGWLCYFFLWFDPFPIHQTLLSNWDTSASKSHLQYQCILWRIDIKKHFLLLQRFFTQDC